MQLSHIIVTAGVALGLAGTTAFADGMRVPVGDLGQRDAAVAFEHRLSEAADRFCSERYRPLELSAIAACQKAIREEAMDQLTPAQREAFEAQLKSSTLASR